MLDTAMLDIDPARSPAVEASCPARPPPPPPPLPCAICSVRKSVSCPARTPARIRRRLMDCARSGAAIAPAGSTRRADPVAGIGRVSESEPCPSRPKRCPSPPNPSPVSESGARAPVGRLNKFNSGPSKHVSAPRPPCGRRRAPRAGSGRANLK
jgi:hypothetical protein